jgi:hypothetical protein
LSTGSRQRLYGRKAIGWLCGLMPECCEVVPRGGRSASVLRRWFLPEAIAPLLIGATASTNDQLIGGRARQLGRAREQTENQRVKNVPE